MRKTALSAIFALSASTSFAQTDVTAQKPGNAGPANLCAELVAFMKASPPEPAPPPKSVEREQKGGSAQDASGQNDPAHAAPRSEEHTSELQSLMRISYAVFCLKKKKTNT